MAYSELLDDSELKRCPVHVRVGEVLLFAVLFICVCEGFKAFLKPHITF